MSINRVLINAQDYTHIRIAEPQQVRYWTARFGLTEVELAELVAVHGSAAATIIRVLGEKVRVCAERPAVIA